MDDEHRKRPKHTNTVATSSVTARVPRIICRRNDPLVLPACSLSSACQRIATPSIDTIIIAASNKIAVAKVKIDNVGKPGVVPTETPESTVRVFPTPHSSNIETLDLHPSGSLLATADASGRASLLRVGSNWRDNVDAAPVASALFQPSSPASHGWCGVRFIGEKIVTASFGGRCISVYDNGKLTSTIATALRPAAMSISSEGLIFIAEGNSLSAWDLRTPSAPVKRIRASPDSLYALATTNQHVAVAGADRSVHVYDIRKWAARGHWSSCLKYSVTAVHFSQEDPSACYVGGLDSELLCGQWSGKSAMSHFDGFRADSRWLGVAKGNHEGRDYVVGCTARGSLYVIVDSFGLYMAPKPKAAHQQESTLEIADE